MADQVVSPQSAVPPAAPRTALLAIVSLVLAILSFACIPIFPVIPAIVCGHVAWSKISKSGGALCGKEIAIAGLIVGYLAIPWAVLQVWFLVGMIQGERGRLHDLAVERQQIASEDGKLEVTTSGFWVKTLELNKEARLQVANKSKDMYLMVFTDAKSAVEGMTLEQRHQTARDRKLQSMQNASSTQTVPLTIDGHAALQDEVSGTQQRTNLVFLHTTVDDGDYFQQIVAWTTKSRWPKQNQELRDITNSFHGEK
ncbi:MAG TPA: DUF4190 domain-containing protein [Chthoniobacterales bacterium]|jgi:hypothetical protein|nr:DUF4190 domain-containing protein [Chthoniobacterales bacterium]